MVPNPVVALRNWAWIAPLVCLTVSTAKAGVDFPGPDPGPARAIVEDGSARLENSVFSITWKVQRDGLSPETLTNKLTGESFPQTGARLFRLATREPEKFPDSTEHRVGIHIGDETVSVYASKGNGRHCRWRAFRGTGSRAVPSGSGLERWI